MLALYHTELRNSILKMPKSRMSKKKKKMKSMLFDAKFIPIYAIPEKILYLFWVSKTMLNLFSNAILYIENAKMILLLKGKDQPVGYRLKKLV